MVWCRALEEERYIQASVCALGQVALLEAASVSQGIPAVTVLCVELSFTVPWLKKV